MICYMYMYMYISVCICTVHLYIYIYTCTHACVCNGAGVCDNGIAPFQGGGSCRGLLSGVC